MPTLSFGSPPVSKDPLFDALVVEDVIKDIFIWLHDSDSSTHCLAMWVHGDDRARIMADVIANWTFNKVICGEKVPIIIVVTGLEHENDPDDWSRREENKELRRRHQMNPKAVACVVSFRGKQNEHADNIYIKSQDKLRMLSKANHRQ